MMNYFEILGVEPTATKADIKRAYFKKIRQYTPEKNPEEFKEIRQAYETLRVDRTRDEYLQIDALDEVTKKNLEILKKEAHIHSYNNVVEVYKDMIERYPHISLIRAQFAEYYKMQGKYGNAVKIFEGLVKEYPEHIGFQISLCETYVMRGWRRKGIALAKRLLEKDPDNVAIWLALIKGHMDAKEYEEAYNLNIEAINNSIQHAGIGFMGIGAFIEQYCQVEDVESLDILTPKLKVFLDYTPACIELEQEQELYQSYFDYQLRQYAMGYIFPVMKIIYKEARHLIKDEGLLENYRVIAEDYEDLIAFKKDESMNERFRDIILYEGAYHYDCFNDNEEAGVDVNLIWRYNLLSRYKIFKKDLRTLEKKYPLIYNRHKDIIDKGKNPRKLEIELDRLHRNIIRQEREFATPLDKLIDQMFGKGKSDFDLSDDEYDPSEAEDFLNEAFMNLPVQEPYVREGKKIGRNDPCPCGSGKKYKKCCLNKG